MTERNHSASLEDYVRDFSPAGERMPLVHVLPGVSLENVITSGRIDPTANSRANKIVRREDGALLDHEGRPLRADIEARLDGTDIAAELNRPMVHFSVGVPYYRPSFSSNKKGLGPLYPCALVFDGDEVKPEAIYGNDTGSFIMNFQHGHDATPNRETSHSGNIPDGVTLQGMKLSSLDSAQRAITALYGSMDAYLHGITTRSAPDVANPHAQFIHTMLTNPLTRPEDAKDASVAIEAKSAHPVDLTKLKGMVIPMSLLANPQIEQFLINHPQVHCRCYDTTPWIDPDHYQVAMMQETYQLYRDLGMVRDVTIEDAPSAAVRGAIARINDARDKQQMPNIVEVPASSIRARQPEGRIANYRLAADMGEARDF